MHVIETGANFQKRQCEMAAMKLPSGARIKYSRSKKKIYKADREDKNKPQREYLELEDEHLQKGSDKFSYKFK